MLENMLAKMNLSLAEGRWENGVDRMNQSNNTTTIVNGQYHTVRPANHDGRAIEGHGWDVWGGPEIDNANNWLGLQKNHTYIILFDVKGKTSNGACNHEWTNNYGWGGHGLSPAPSDVSMTCNLPSNFVSNDFKTVYYKWTINDDIYKVCTSSYSRFEEGKTYLSYREFGYGWSYAETGPMGTDIYLRNFRMYDITNLSKEDVKFLKTGNIEATLFSNEHEKTSIGKYGEINTNDIIEN